MNDTIIIEIEMVNTAFGSMARFWMNNSFTQVDLRRVLDEMNRLSSYYNNTCGKAVMFTVK